MANKSQPLALPDALFSQLAQADKDRGFPPGTMQSLLMQETGGQAKYLNDPTTYHYPVGPDGKRKSSARGPFGILDSTAADPGYGVKPLANHADLNEHIRFTGDYLDARAKSAGSLHAGIAGFGEGDKYAVQVARRRDGVVTPAPVVAAQATPPVTPSLTPSIVQAAAPVAPVVQAQAPTEPVQQAGISDWQAINDNVRAKAAVRPQDLAYGGPKPYVPPEVVRPDFMATLGSLGQNVTPNFRPFSGIRGRA